MLNRSYDQASLTVALCIKVAIYSLKVKFYFPVLQED